MATSEAEAGVLLTDIQVTGLAANQTDFYSQSGLTNTSGQNSIQMTPDSVDSTDPTTNTYWHGLFIDYEPGVLWPDATEPDLQMWFWVDDADYQSYFYIDLTRSRSMLTHREQTSGHHYIKLGDSMILAARAGNFPLVNGPFKFTGPKISDDITYHFSSASGFTTSLTDSTATFMTPPTIKMWGDVYNQALWAWVVSKMPNQAWQGAINVSSLRRTLNNNLGPFLAGHVVNGNINSVKDVWPTLPDGPSQTGRKVYRFGRFATPVTAVSGAFTLSNKVIPVNGKPGQVGQFNELAWGYSSTPGRCRVIDLFGRRPATNSGYFGLTFGTNKYYPDDNGKGVVDTIGNPRAWYGENETYTGIKNQFDRLPQNYGWVPGMAEAEVIANEDAGYFVAPQNGKTISANTDYTAVIGYAVD